MRGMVSVIAVCGILCAPAAQAQAPEGDARIFTQSGPWALDYGEDYCRLVGTFSNGPDEIALGMERIQPGQTLRIILIGDGIKPYRRASEIGYHFLPSGENRKAPLLRSETPDGQQYLNLGPVRMGPAPTDGQTAPPPYSRDAEKEFAKGVDGVMLESGLSESIRIETGPLDDAVGAVQICTDELLTHWGLDAEKHRTWTRPPAPAGNISEWLPGGTIGFGDFGRLRGGNNAVRLMIDGSGKPTECQIHWPSLDEEVNGAICTAMMENAQFQPALDAEGQPMATFWTIEPLWLMGPPRR